MDLPKPDFGRVSVNTGQKRQPVGDPTLWANSITTPVDIQGLLPGGGVVVDTQPRIINGAQIIIAQAADQYARSWSLLGNVSLPNNCWNTVNALDPLAPLVPDPSAIRDDFFEVWLEITQGIGLITTKQLVLLSAGATSQRWGLIPNQITVNGGPYGQLETQVTVTGVPTTTYITRSFAMIGALIGNTIGVRAIYSRGGLLGQPPTVPHVVTSLLLTPYAPGHGI